MRAFPYLQLSSGVIRWTWTAFVFPADENLEENCIVAAHLLKIVEIVAAFSLVKSPLTFWQFMQDVAKYVIHMFSTRDRNKEIAYFTIFF